MRTKIQYQEFDNPVELKVETKCPEKWILIDRETGQVYQGNANGYCALS